MMFDRETAQSKKVIEKINASRGNILDREPISRRAPKGRRSIVSDKSVEYISKDMEKRVRKGITAVGQSIGF